MTDEEFPPFDEAIGSFRVFLARMTMPTNIVWTFREDVTGHRRKLWLRAELEGNAAAARSLYDVGVARERGLTIRALCLATSPQPSAVCYVWVPEDDIAASYAMQPRGLKYNVPKDHIVATTVRSRLMWSYRVRFNTWRGETPFLGEVPRRDATRLCG